MFVAALIEVEFRKIAVGVIEIEAAVVDIGDPSQVMPRGKQSRRGGIIVGRTGNAGDAVVEREEHAVIPYRNAGIARGIPDVAASIPDIGNWLGGSLERRISPRLAVLIGRGSAGS